MIDVSLTASKGIDLKVLIVITISSTEGVVGGTVGGLTILPAAGFIRTSPTSLTLGWLGFAKAAKGTSDA